MRQLSRTNVICIGCPKGCSVTVETDNGQKKDIKGYQCPTGEDYAKEEFKNPTRILPTTVKVIQGEFPLVSVKTAKPIPKDKIKQAMQKTAQIKVKAPVEIGDVICENIADTGVALVATNQVSLK